MKNYVIKVEFQFRGSPHVHSFIWVQNAPKLNETTKQDYIEFVDKIVRADLPDAKKEPDLHRLVSRYQVHTHSQSRRKYKNVPYRFHYGRYFTARTIIGEPLIENFSESDKLAMLSNRAKVLGKVKAYIDEYLDPHKPNYSDTKSIAEILSLLGLTEQEYYNALSISSRILKFTILDLQTPALLTIALMWG